jgi:hypothetical protein
MLTVKSGQVLSVIVLSAFLMAGMGSGDARAEGAAVAPEALQTLKRMTDYVGGLKRFSLETQNTIEEVLDSGQKIEHDFSASVAISRPDKLRSERRGAGGNQIFVYDGKSLTIYDEAHDTWASAKAPPDLDGALTFAREELDIVPPAGDIVFTNAYALLTANLTAGMVVGKATIGGVSCDQLAFRTPEVDWQIWIADGDQPLPQKYVLTTNDDPAKPEFVTLMNGWQVAPKFDDAMFRFSPPKGAKKTEFLRVDQSGSSGQ